MIRLLIFWLMAAGATLAQPTTVVLGGKVLDRDSGEPVAYATLLVQGTSLGVIANRYGAFEMRLPDSLTNTGRLLRISAVGYQNNFLKLDHLKPDSVYIVHLRPVDYTTGEVVITSTSRSPQEIIAEAYRRMPQNYADEPYLLQLFYRHYCREGDMYGRLIEAAVDVYDTKGHKRLMASPANKMQTRVRQLRRSYDFTSLSGRAHMPIALWSMLKRDITSYDHPLRLHPEEFSFSMRDTTLYEGAPVFVIDFQQDVSFQEQEMFAGNGPNDSLVKRGTLWINADDMAVLRTEFWYKAQYFEDTAFFRQERHQTIAWRPYDGKYFLSQLTSDGFDDEPGMEPHRYHIEIMTNAILRQNEFTPFKGDEPTRDQLNGIGYNPNFWDNYSILKATPLEDQIAEDLASRLPLEDQFANFNRLQINPDSLSSIEESQFDKIVNAYRGRLLYVLFWNSQNKASVQEVKATRELAYQYMGMGVTFFFISTDEDADVWEQARQRYAPTTGEHLHAATGGDGTLLKRFGVDALPYHFVIAPNGHILREEIRLPSDRKLYLQLQTIMRGEWKEEGGNL